MARLASAPLALIKVAPGRIFIGGEPYSYAEHSFTLEEACANGGHIVVVRDRSPVFVADVSEPSRWERFRARWPRRWPKGYEEIGAVVVDQ